MPEEHPVSESNRQSRRYFSGEVQTQALPVMDEYASLALNALSLSRKIAATDERRAEVLKKLSDASYGISAHLISSVPRSVVLKYAEEEALSVLILKNHDRAVLEQVAKGKKYNEIAVALGIDDPKNVSSRMSKMRGRTGIRDTYKLVEHFANLGEFDFSEEDQEALRKRLKKHPTMADPDESLKNAPSVTEEILEEPVDIDPTGKEKAVIEVLFRSHIVKSLNWLQKLIHQLTDDSEPQGLENYGSIELENTDIRLALLERGLITDEEFSAKYINRHAYIAGLIINGQQRNQDRYKGLFLTASTAESSLKIIAEEEKKFIEDRDKKPEIPY